MGFGFPQGPQILVTDSNMKTELEQEFNKNTQLQQLLDKTKRELQENQDQWVSVCIINVKTWSKCAFPTEIISLSGIDYWLDLCDMFFVFRMVELRMDREVAESRLRQQEDQLAQLQEELRRMMENSPQSDSMQLVRMIVVSGINNP